MASLAGSTLGLASTSTNFIWIDRDAAGYGWSLGADSVQPGAVDLLSTLAHELGHKLGYDDHEMGATLEVGVRQLPLVDWRERALPISTVGCSLDQIARDQVFAGDLDDARAEPGCCPQISWTTWRERSCVELSEQSAPADMPSESAWSSSATAADACLYLTSHWVAGGRARRCPSRSSGRVAGGRAQRCPSCSRAMALSLSQFQS